MAKHVKKLLVLVVAFALVLSLAACGSSASDDGAAADTGDADAAVSAEAEATEETEETEEVEAEAEEEEEVAEEADSDIPENEIDGDISAEDAFVVWGWNTDFATLKGLLEENYPELAGRLVLVNCGGSGYYQDKIDQILDDPDNELYPDIMLLEVGYVQKYVQSDYLIDLADIGITDEDTADQYTYMKELGSTADGVQKASFWQSTPGCMNVRADLAEKYLGTTDQAELEAMFSASWDDIVTIAEQVNEASGGMCKLFSGYDDLKYVFLNGMRSVGWYDDTDTIQMDDAMIQYMELSKTLYDEDLTFNATMWDTDWYALMDGDGETTEAALAYCGCPWYTYWSISADTWSGNDILVDYPDQFYWGGTGLAVTVGCSDTETAAQIIKACTCDADFMTQIFQANGDFVNNTAAVQTIVDEGIPSTSSFTLYNDQNIPEFFLTRGEGINVSCVVPEDATINEGLFPAAVTEYATGAADLDTAIADFESSVHDTYPYLSIGE